MAPGEIRRFVDRFGVWAVLDFEGKAYIDGGLKYLKLSDTELLGQIEREPKLVAAALDSFRESIEHRAGRGYRSSWFILPRSDDPSALGQRAEV